MASKAQMEILTKTIDKMGMSLRSGMFKSIEDGMITRKKATLKKYGCLTVNYLMYEIRKDIPFQEQMARLDIHLEDMEKIAQRLVTAHEKGPEVHKTLSNVGRNEPCPCGSGKKYKKCCGR